VDKQLEIIAGQLSSLLPGESKSSLVSKAYEECRDQGDLESVEERMMESLHDRCVAATRRVQGLDQLRAGVSQFRGKQVVPESVLAANRLRIREHGGLTNELKRELGMETASETKARESAESLGHQERKGRSPKGVDDE